MKEDEIDQRIDRLSGYRYSNYDSISNALEEDLLEHAIEALKDWLSDRENTIDNEAALQKVEELTEKIFSENHIQVYFFILNKMIGVFKFSLTFLKNIIGINPYIILFSSVYYYKKNTVNYINKICCKIWVDEGIV